MPKNLEIQLLGSFSVKLNEQSVHSFRTSKTRALLAHLATEADREHSRSTLATLFWGELPDAAAKTNLRIELSNIKQLLAAHPAVEFARTFVRFHSALATIDVQTFQEGVRAFLALPTESQGAALPRLTAALDLYRGEFLAGFHVGNAVEFEDWQLITREQLHEQMMLALATLQVRYAEQARWPELADTARRQLAVVPWTESAHRHLMQALAAQGQIQAALAQFERCRAVLQEELGVEPSLATLELAARLRGETSGLRSVQHNLTLQLKTFVGRGEEIAQLRTLVCGEKLVTLLGIGGVGKSHLAQTVAQNVLHNFVDGVWFVPLANIATGEAAPERIALAIAAAVGFQITDMQQPLAELAAHLADKQMLLVLDNWEHLIEAAPNVLNALLYDTSIHLLATSRVRLMFEEERVLQLNGLPQVEAYTLFVERARRVVPTFAPDSSGFASSAAIFRICEQVGGLPLGIELAATWVEHYSVAEIGQSLEEFAVQPQQTKGLLDRHHRLSSVFEFSWQLLSPRQQQILSRLSVFRGGFDRTAATVVAESALSELSVLIAHSLVQRVSAGRYNLHPLIQEFASGKLVTEEAANLHAKYAQHYLSTLVATPRALWQAQLFDDFENMRVAWQRAIQARAATIVQPAASAFREYINHFGLLLDGNNLFVEAIEQFEGDAKQRELVALLLGQQALFVRSLEGLKGASVLQQRVLKLTTDSKILFFGHSDLANYYAEIGEWGQADFHFDRAEALAQESGDLLLYIESVESRSHINAIHFRGDFAKSIARLQELLMLLDRTKVEGPSLSLADELRLRLYILNSLALIATRYGDYALAMRYSQMGITLADEVGQRQRRMHFLLDFALAEQFSGNYAAAIAHNLEALAIAEEIGDVDEMALLKANLCLTMRQSGALSGALAYGLEAIDMLVSLGNKRIEGQARNRVGHTLAVLARWADAYAAYGEALSVWATVQHPNRYEAIAGRAVAALQLGQRSEALALVEEVLNFILGNGVIGIVEPVRLLLNCEAVLTGVGQGERGHQVLLQAKNWVQTIASRISDDNVRATFLDSRPDNQLLKLRVSSLLDKRC